MKVNHLYKGYTIIKEGFAGNYPYLVYKNDADNNIEYFVDCEPSIKSAKQHIDEDYYNNKPNEGTLEEYFDKYGDTYCWESSLEEDLIEEDYFNEGNNPQSREYEPKDIVMVNDDVAGVHRILIITKKHSNNSNSHIYSGFLLSSKIQKANINSKYPNNIYIKNYSTILDRGAKYDKEAIIRVDDLRTFNENNFSKSGTYKGTVTDEFFNFILKCANNYQNHISNKNMVWDK